MIKKNGFKLINKYITLAVVSLVLMVTTVTAAVMSVKSSDEPLEVVGSPRSLTVLNPKAGLTPTQKLVWAKKQVLAMKQLPFSLASSLGDGSTKHDNHLYTLPLFHPSVFSIKDGSKLYLYFEGVVGHDSHGGDIELRIYDTRGNQIYSGIQNVTNTAKVAKIPFGAAELGHDNMPAGVYFFLVLYNGEVLRNSSGDIVGKGKFAIAPS